MNKQDIINKISEKANLNKKQSESAINAFLEVISDALCNDESVQFTGFGTFKTNTRAARKGRNPKTGEEIDIPESRVPVFKAGNNLKKAVKG